MKEFGGWLCNDNVYLISVFIYGAIYLLQQSTNICYSNYAIIALFVISV